MDKNKKQFIGFVTSDKMNKSRTVEIVELQKHPMYGKFVKRRKKFMVHDEQNISTLHDKVLIEESVPTSKRKRWTLVKVLEKVEA